MQYNNSTMNNSPINSTTVVELADASSLRCGRAALSGPPPPHLGLGYFMLYYLCKLLFPCVSNLTSICQPCIDYRTVLFEV